MRFLAICGPKAAREPLEQQVRRRSAGTLSERFANQALSLWTESGASIVIGPNAAAVGMMFERPDNKRLAQLPVGPSVAQSVATECWGPYVLFESDGRDHAVLRDPSGAIPAYHGRVPQLDLYASDADLMRLVWPQPFEPNLDALRHWLLYPFLRTAASGAQGIAELGPGVLHRVMQGRVRQRKLWSPAAFAAPAQAITDFTAACASIRKEILECVPLLASSHKRVLLRLSGGLDSSILAAALAGGNVRFRAVTFATRSAGGDERRYARDLASRFGFDLHELREDELPSQLDTKLNPFRRPPSPVLQPLRRMFASAVHADELVMDGAGGDNVFASSNSASPAVDALRFAGPGAALRTLKALSAVHGCTIWRAASSALHRAISPPPSWPLDRRFLISHAAATAQDPHPWLDDLRGLGPGSADQVQLLAAIYHFLDDPADGPAATLHPLLCQPVVEACLKIAPWLWVEGGRDRAVARAAFRGILPAAILDRRSKGSLESLFARHFNATRVGLLDLLVRGRLARLGMIDPKSVAAALDARRPFSINVYIRILEIASAEQWLRSFD